MRDVRKELFLKARSLLARLFQYNGNPSPLRAVLYDDGILTSRPHTFEQCCDVNIAPELFSVPPEAPSLIFCPACLLSLLQLFLGHAIPDVFWGEHAREILPHNLGLSVPQHALGSAIPTRHASS